MPLGLFKGERTFTLAPQSNGATEFTLRAVFIATSKTIEPARIASALCGEHSTGSIFLHIAVVGRCSHLSVVRFPI
jgi:hypothetical protein